MQITEEIKTIIREGKLKTYNFGSSFIEVFWEHPSLSERSYYRFRFTTMNEALIDVIVDTPTRLYIKQNPRVYKKLAESLVKGLL